MNNSNDRIFYKTFISSTSSNFLLICFNFVSVFKNREMIILKIFGIIISKPDSERKEYSNALQLRPRRDRTPGGLGVPEGWWWWWGGGLQQDKPVNV